MKTSIYFFSGTGNSLDIARELGTMLGAGEPVSIPAVMAGKAQVTQSEVVGIVFPVYIWGLPRIVKRFLEKLPASEARYLFSVATCGGAAGDTHRQLDKALRPLNGVLDAAFTIRMPGNYIPMYGAPSQQTQNKLFSNARRSIHDIAAAVGRLEHRPPGRGFPPFRWLGSLFYKIGMPSMPKADRKFRADARCNSCGICVRVCPVANIRLEGEPARPAWQHDCEQCLACLQWCPVEAIQMGKKTEKRRRYRHPAVQSKDLFLR